MKTLKLISITLLLVSFEAFSNEDYEEGKRLYAETCVSCHGAQGETNKAMKLTVTPRRLNESILSQEQMALLISEGGHKYGAHSDIMPAFKYVYEEEQIENIALYVSQTFNTQRDERINKLLAESTAESIDEKKMLKIGKKIFKRNCSLCHGLKGDGDSIYVEQSKENDQFLFPYDLRKILLNEEQIFLYVKFGGHYWGTAKEDMPSWKKKYNDTKLKSVARYVKLKILGTDK